MQALPYAAYFLLLEASVGGAIALFWIHLRGDVNRGFTIFTGICLAVSGVLAVWLRTGFPPLVSAELNPTAVLWFAAERALTLTFVVLFVVYLVGLSVSTWSRLARLIGAGPKHQTPHSTAAELRLTDRPRGAAEKPPTVSLAAPLGPLVPLVGLAGLWSAALVNPSGQLLGLGAPLTILAGAIALGSALTALSLGHWYLVAPTLSVRPLVQVTLLCLVAVLVQALLVPLILVLPGAPRDRVQALWSEYAIFFGVRVVFGLIVPALGSVMAWRTARIRSLDSATGLLYVVAALVLAGEIAARTLYFLTGVAT